MTFRRLLLAPLVSYLLLACGGQAEQKGSGPEQERPTVGGAGGSAGSSARGGYPGSGGSNGGTGAVSVGGAMTACCNAYPSCPARERQVPSSAACSQQAVCHSVSICCSTIWCAAEGGTGGTGGTGGSGTGTGGSGTGTGGSAGTGAAHDCSTMTCSATQACLAYRTLGGPVMLYDGGPCSAGTYPGSGSGCEPDFAYACAELRGKCANQPVTCECAEPTIDALGTCPAGYGSCFDPALVSGTAAKTQLICERLVP